MRLRLTENNYSTRAKSRAEVSENIHKGSAKPLLNCNHTWKKGKRYYFMSTLPSTYYNRLIGHASASFADLLQTEDCIRMTLKQKRLKIITH